MPGVVRDRLRWKCPCYTRDRAIITGVSGFTGPHLAKLLLAQGVDVFGLDRVASQAVRGLENDVHLINIDLLDKNTLCATVQKIQPAYIFHLASTNHSDDLAQLWANNVQATDHLLQAALPLAADAQVRVFIPGSASEYGVVQSSDLPVSEQQPLRPVSLYGVSKATQFLLAQSYYLKAGLAFFGSRAFNLIGPGEQPTMVCSTLAHQIAAIEQGLQEPILRVGNLASERDFIDVRDAVRAYWAIVTLGKPGEVYNVCSGRATSIHDILDMLLEQVTVPLEIRVDPHRLRRDDVPCSVGDNRKITEQTGWQPKINLAESLADVLNYWHGQHSANNLTKA